MQIRGEITSVEIVAVYAERCYTIGRRLNLVTEEYYDEALKEAAEKDRIREEAVKNGEVHKLGPLHGIPISVKDQVNCWHIQPLTSIDM